MIPLLLHLPPRCPARKWCCLGGPAHCPLLPQWQALSVPEAPQYRLGPGLLLRIPSTQSEPGGGPSGRLYQQNKEGIPPVPALWKCSVLSPGAGNYAQQPSHHPGLSHYGRTPLSATPRLDNTDLYRGTTSGHHSLSYVSRIL